MKFIRVGSAGHFPHCCTGPKGGMGRKGQGKDFKGNRGKNGGRKGRKGKGVVFPFPFPFPLSLTPSPFTCASAPPALFTPRLLQAAQAAGVRQTTLEREVAELRAELERARVAPAGQGAAQVG
jgi:hypothetical protein